MKNLSFLKGLAVGIGIAVVGGVVYANSISTTGATGVISWTVVNDKVYLCRGLETGVQGPNPKCFQAEMYVRD